MPWKKYKTQFTAEALSYKIQSDEEAADEDAEDFEDEASKGFKNRLDFLEAKIKGLIESVAALKSDS